MQLCKIDSEGKARKVVGCSCVVVKVQAHAWILLLILVTCPIWKHKTEDILKTLNLILFLEKTVSQEKKFFTRQSIGVIDCAIKCSWSFLVVLDDLSISPIFFFLFCT